MKIAICSLGCAKNLVDSERIIAILKNVGYDFTEDFAKADIIIVNTCGFIASAKEESVNAIIGYAALKESGCRCLVVTGCLVQKYEEELKAEIPEVDIWLNTLNFETIAQRLSSFFPAMRTKADAVYGRRVLTTPSHWAYLKIAEGCNNGCTFCAIPQMRGPYVSRSIEDIAAEADELVDAGVKEINLLAQDTTVYGKDIYGKPKLKELLRELVKKEFLRIRVLYSYPNCIDDELLSLMAAEPKICKYLDVPMQHSEDRLLKAMGRPERRQKLERFIERVRAADADFALRSTFIVGFPGETRADFEGLCAFLIEAKLDWVGAFPYSREENTKAYDLPDQVPEEVKEERYDEIMALLSRCSAQNLKRWVGREFQVLIEGVTEDDDVFAAEYPYYGRTSFQGPEVDGVVYLKATKPYEIGELVTVKITGSDVYDLTGAIVKSEEIK